MRRAKTLENLWNDGKILCVSCRKYKSPDEYYASNTQLKTGPRKGVRSHCIDCSLKYSHDKRKDSVLNNNDSSRVSEVDLVKMILAPDAKYCLILSNFVPVAQLKNAGYEFKLIDKKIEGCSFVFEVK